MRTCFVTSWASCAQRYSYALLIALAGFAGACAGDIGESGSSSETPGDDNATSAGTGPGGARGTSSECQKAAVEPGPSPIRRLTIHEYNNTVRDLLNTTSPANAFPEEERGLGF